MKRKRDCPTRIDEEIDAALGLLREMRTPEAMADRVHQRLEVAAANTYETRRNWLFWVPVTGVAMAAVLLLIFSQAHWVKQTSPVEPAKLVTATPVPGRMAASRPALAPGMSSETRKPTLQAPVVRRRGREHPQDRHVANLFSYPLTRQEKLLVQFARTASPAELQMLNPEYQAKIEAQQEAEFSAYLKSEDGSNTQETAN